MQPLEYDAMNPSNRMKIALQSPVNRSNRVQHIAASTESFNQINMDILEQIVETKKKHVADCQAIYPVAFLEKSIYFPTKPVSLSRYNLRDDKVGIIAEIKKKISFERHFQEWAGPRSASQSDICRQAHRHFQSWPISLTLAGQNSDLTAARRFNYCPYSEEGLYHLRISDSGVKVHRCRRNIADSKNPDQEEIIRFTDLAHIGYGSCLNLAMSRTGPLLSGGRCHRYK